ncbi:hypothetical protein Trydic_g5074, partial [Trypoxylus dichotomus]
DAGVQSLIEAYDLPTFHFRNRRFRSHSDFSLMFSSFPIKALAWFPYERPSSRQQRRNRIRNKGIREEMWLDSPEKGEGGGMIMCRGRRNPDWIRIARDQRAMGTKDPGRPRKESCISTSVETP